MMEVESDVTVDDLRALRRFLLRTRPGRDVVLIEYFSVALAGFVPYFLLSVVLEDRLRIWIPPEYTVGLALAQLAVWSLLYLWALRSASRRLVRRSATVAAGRHRLVLTDAGVFEERPQGEVSHRWSAVTAVHDRPDHILIGVGADGYYVIPKRSFAAPAAASEFVTEIRRQQSRSAERLVGSAPQRNEVAE